MTPFLEIWLSGFLLSMVFLIFLWIISVFLKNASIIDPFWGMGFVILSAFYMWSTENPPYRSWALMSMVSIWGLRLSIYLFLRNLGKGEDYRYQQFRRDYGPNRYWWVSFFQVFLLQGVIMSVVALPLLGSMMEPSEWDAPLLFWPAVVLWIIGFIFEAGGDYQLVQFKKKRKTGEVLQTGLWKYSRHPNYFGDALIWWAIGLMSVSNGYFWPLLGPLVMNWLLLKISGVSLLEQNLKETKPHYKAYMEKTSAFFPWFPKQING